MSNLSSQNIVISSALPGGFRKPEGNIFANSPILDLLLPQLFFTQANEHKAQQLLDNIDAYMLQETEELLKRVNNICLQLKLSGSPSFTIKIGEPALRISGHFDEKKRLGELINQDNWITSTFDWLHANYSALAYSQELLKFSYAYQKNRQQALDKYEHFEFCNQGVDCYVNCNVDRGLPNLEWRIESPLTVYHLQK